MNREILLAFLSVCCVLAHSNAGAAAVSGVKSVTTDALGSKTTLADAESLNPLMSDESESIASSPDPLRRQTRQIYYGYPYGGYYRSYYGGFGGYPYYSFGYPRYYGYGYYPRYSYGYPFFG